MRLLFLVFLGWLTQKALEKLRAWRQHRKLARQLQDLGVYGGTIKIKHARSAPPEPVPLSAEPDGPVPFGYKTAWTAVRCEDPERVIAALGPRAREPANWAGGLAAAGDGRVFVSPCLDGFVLVIGRQRPISWRQLALFPEVQMFYSHRVANSYVWAKYGNGICVRRYQAWDGDVEETGPLTPEELALGFAQFPHPGEAWAEDQRLPGEEDVLDIAAAWGVDPRFERKTCPPSTGWLCTW